MKDFMINNVEYTFDEMLQMSRDDNMINLVLKTSDIIYLRTGEIVNVEDIQDLYTEENNRIIEQSAHLSKTTIQKISKSANKDIIENRRKDLEYKLDNNIITSEEYKELITIKLGKFHNPMMLDGFCIYNLQFKGESRKPDNLSILDYGKFNVLIDNMYYDNSLTHKNGRNINKKTLMGKLEITDVRTFDRFINILILNKMIALVKYGSGEKIIINPLYVLRNKEIDYTLWCLFKDSKLKEFLSEYTIKYFELKDSENIKDNTNLISEYN